MVGLFDRKRVGRLLVASLCLNLIFILLASVWIYRRGGLQYLGEKLGFEGAQKPLASWQVDWRARNEALPNLDNEVVFAGDSITAGTPWSEYYSRIRNRGIGGDTAASLQQRLDEIVESAPKQLFLNVGINDLAAEVPQERVVADILAIVRRTHELTLSTDIFVCSILPTNLDVATKRYPSVLPENIRKVNIALASHQNEEGYRFVDLSPAFSDESGRLRRELTRDGLHLNNAGKRIYCETLLPYVDTDAAKALCSQRKLALAETAKPRESLDHIASRDESDR